MEASDNIRGTLRELLESGPHSDLTLVCRDGGDEFPVHQAILCGQSDVMYRAINGNSEGSEGRKVVVDFGPRAVGYMLDFMYDGDYTIDDEILSCDKALSCGPVLEAMDHVLVSSIASYYSVTALCRLSRVNMARVLNDSRPPHASEEVCPFKKVYGMVFEEQATADPELHKMLDRIAEKHQDCGTDLALALLLIIGAGKIEH